MVNMVALWGEGFRKHYPNVRIEVEGKGSSTAPPALISGAAQVGAMSREMRPSEIDAFEARYGYKPTMLQVALDALAVYVHKDNPIQGLTLAKSTPSSPGTNRAAGLPSTPGARPGSPEIGPTVPLAFTAVTPPPAPTDTLRKWRSLAATFATR